MTKNFRRTLCAQVEGVPNVDFPSAMVVYGAGHIGRYIASLLLDKAIEPIALIDRNARPGDTWHEVPILTVADWQRRRGRSERMAVVIAIHSPGYDVSEVISHLVGAGFGPIFTLFDLCDRWPEAFSEHFWLAPRASYARHIDELERLHDLLCDEISKQVLRSVVEFRLTGNYSALSAPEPLQYTPSTLPRWSDPIRLVDCGAYTGDTLEAFLTSGYRIEAAVCLEPDPSSFLKLVEYISGAEINAVCMPCAASDHAERLSFSAEGNSSSRIGSGGGTSVQAISLDQTIPRFAPTLIKMDIEGAEPEALTGAQGVISNYCPELAISIYHRAEHLWQIPSQVIGLVKNYKLAMRAHAYNSFEVVLYARK